MVTKGQNKPYLIHTNHLMVTVPDFWYRRDLTDAIVVGEDLKFESSGGVGGYIGEH